MGDVVIADVAQAPSTASRRAPALGGRALGLWLGLPALAVLLSGWLQRWTADDALITFRVVRQIDAGNGPVYNVGQRVEASTSVLWTWLLAGLNPLTGSLEITWLAVVVGLLCSVAAVSIATLTSLRIDALRPRGGHLLPGGLLVFLAVPAVWEYYTSGLETGLTFLWLAGAWAILAGCCLRPRESLGLGHSAAAGVGLGLGNLVRPELALVSVIFVGAATLCVRKRGIALALAIGTVLPGLAYEVFRAGYYGQLVPNTALAKEATSSRLSQGLIYLADLVISYQLWLPLLLLGWVVLRRIRDTSGAESVVLLAPVVAGSLLALYVVRLGGDFMHARMLLPSLLLVLLPTWTVRQRVRTETLLLSVVAAWSLACAAFLRVPYAQGAWHYVVDERGEWARLAGTEHPVTIADHLRSTKKLTDRARLAVAHQEPVLIYRVNNKTLVDYRETPLLDGTRPVVAVDILGAGGFSVPLQYKIIDQRGLADPVAAHQRLTVRAQVGHEKYLALPWLLALVPGSTIPHGTNPASVDDARAALACGRLAGLEASVDSPLGWHRFWSNLKGSFAQTTLRVSADPARARAEQCSG